MITISRIFTWWNGHTIGTWLHTRRSGEKVGEDSLGNIYYQSEGGRRRWVLYNGESEASRVSPDWHGWLHHTFDRPPTESPLPAKAWEKPHVPNLTGTALAYAPPGSVSVGGDRARTGADYQAWSPE